MKLTDNKSRSNLLNRFPFNSGEAISFDVGRDTRFANGFGLIVMVAGLLTGCLLNTIGCSLTFFSGPFSVLAEASPETKFEEVLMG